MINFQRLPFVFGLILVLFCVIVMTSAEEKSVSFLNSEFLFSSPTVDHPVLYGRLSSDVVLNNNSLFWAQISFASEFSTGIVAVKFSIYETNSSSFTGGETSDTYDYPASSFKTDSFFLRSKNPSTQNPSFNIAFSVEFDPVTLGWSDQIPSTLELHFPLADEGFRDFRLTFPLTIAKPWGGAGYSSFHHSHTLPYDEFKLHPKSSAILSKSSFRAQDILANNWSVVFPYNSKMLDPDYSMKLLVAGSGFFSTPKFNSEITCRVNQIQVKSHFLPGETVLRIQLHESSSFLATFEDLNSPYVHITCDDVIIYFVRHTTAETVDITTGVIVSLEPINSSGPPDHDHELATTSIFLPLSSPHTSEPHDSLLEIGTPLNSPLAQTLYAQTRYSSSLLLFSTDYQVSGQCSQEFKFSIKDDFNSYSTLNREQEITITLPFIDHSKPNNVTVVAMIPSWRNWGRTPLALASAELDASGSIKTLLLPNFTLPRSVDYIMFQVNFQGHVRDSLFYDMKRTTGSVYSPDDTSTYSTNYCSFEFVHNSAPYNPYPTKHRGARGYGFAHFPLASVNDARLYKYQSQDKRQDDSPWRLNMKSTTELKLSIFSTDNKARYISQISFHLSNSIWQFIPHSNQSPVAEYGAFRVTSLPTCMSLRKLPNHYQGQNIWDAIINEPVNMYPNLFRIDTSVFRPLVDKIEFDCPGRFYHASKDDFLSFYRKSDHHKLPVPNPADHLPINQLDILLLWVELDQPEVTHQTVLHASSLSSQQVVQQTKFDYFGPRFNYGGSLPLTYSSLDDSDPTPDTDDKTPDTDDKTPDDKTPGPDDDKTPPERDEATNQKKALSSLFWIIIFVLSGIVGLAIVIVTCIVCCIYFCKRSTDSYSTLQDNEMTNTSVATVALVVPSSQYQQPNQPSTFQQQSHAHYAPLAQTQTNYPVEQAAFPVAPDNEYNPYA